LEMDYHAIGGRVARRRKKLGLTQAKVAEQAEISDQYLSNIERAVSIPSVEVLMRLAAALDTTPDEFLVGTARSEGQAWRSVAEQLRPLDARQLRLVERFICWTSGQDI
jgi:transcriptional regulator with XRE-family HTH domain